MQAQLDGMITVENHPTAACVKTSCVFTFSYALLQQLLVSVVQHTFVAQCTYCSVWCWRGDRVAQRIVAAD